jgi:hypothetical protein
MTTFASTASTVPGAVTPPGTVGNPAGLAGDTVGDIIGKVLRQILPSMPGPQPGGQAPPQGATAAPGTLPPEFVGGLVRGLLEKLGQQPSMPGPQPGGQAPPQGATTAPGTLTPEFVGGLLNGIIGLPPEVSKVTDVGRAFFPFAAGPPPVGQPAPQGAAAAPGTLSPEFVGGLVRGLLEKLGQPSMPGPSVGILPWYLRDPNAWPASQGGTSAPGALSPQSSIGGDIGQNIGDFAGGLVGGLLGGTLRRIL